MDLGLESRSFCLLECSISGLRKEEEILFPQEEHVQEPLPNAIVEQALDDCVCVCVCVKLHLNLQFSLEAPCAVGGTVTLESYGSAASGLVISIPQRWVLSLPTQVQRSTGSYSN